MDTEMDRVHVDDGWLIYMPNVFSDTPVSPYWMQFIGIAKFSENILFLLCIQNAPENYY